MNFSSVRENVRPPPALLLLAILLAMFVAVAFIDDGKGWGFWLEQTRNGLTTGSIYALIALGYTMVYGILRMINFAHGEIFMCGAFGAYFLATRMSNTGFLNENTIAAVLAMILFAMIISTAVVLLVERI